MTDEYEETGTCRDIDGAPIRVGHVRSVVVIDVSGKLAVIAGRGMIHLGPDEREHFSRLYQSAALDAEAWAAAHPEGDEAL